MTTSTGPVRPQDFFSPTTPSFFTSASSIVSLDSSLVSFHCHRLQYTRQLARSVTTRFSSRSAATPTISDPPASQDIKMDTITTPVMRGNDISSIKTTMASRHPSTPSARAELSPLAGKHSPSFTTSSSSSSSTAASSVVSLPSSATTVCVNDMLYSARELRAMAEELDQALRAGEFPTTRHLNHNSNATVDDYKRLLELRDASSPTARQIVFVAMTRDLRERDAEIDEKLERQRALRHVNSCLRSVQEEERLYRIMQTALSHNTHAVTKHDLKEILVTSKVASKGDLANVASKRDLADATIASKRDLARIRGDLEDIFAAINDNSDRDVELLQARLDLVSRQVHGVQSIIDEQIGDLTSQIETMQSSLASLPAAISTLVQAAMQQQAAASQQQQVTPIQESRRPASSESFRQSLRKSISKTMRRITRREETVSGSVWTESCP